ncbi:MAG: hypothetical protein QOE70_1720 [Chthoniobacter sp.]|jgi:hypothetical protein|nr:hypothetical protein [Chthoniobacter sp.]
MKAYLILSCAILVFISRPSFCAEPDPVKAAIPEDSRIQRATAAEEKPPEPPKPDEKPRYEWREFAIADIHDLQFDAWDGAISFTIGDETYVFRPRADDKTAAPTDLTAGAAVLAQLRLAEWVRIPVLITAEPEKKHVISRWILKFSGGPNLQSDKPTSDRPIKEGPVTYISLQWAPNLSMEATEGKEDNKQIYSNVFENSKPYLSLYPTLATLRYNVIEEGVSKERHISFPYSSIYALNWKNRAEQGTPANP